MDTNTEKRLCKDCKHSFMLWYDIVFFSNRRYNMKCRKNYKEQEDDGNLVTGPKVKAAHFENCSITRIGSDRCGPDGSWWQPKDPKKLFSYMKSV